MASFIQEDIYDMCLKNLLDHSLLKESGLVAQGIRLLTVSTIMTSSKCCRSLPVKAHISLSLFSLWGMFWSLNGFDHTLQRALR